MKKLLVVVLLLAGFLLIAYISAPVYLRNALTYYTADIDDYTIFENRKVLNGSIQPWTEHPEYNRRFLADSLQQKIETYEPVAFLVAQNGQILHEQYWDGYNAESYSNSFSMAKSIIGLLVGIALEEGHIGSLDEPAGKYLPAYQKGKNSALTIRHLLTMSSGLNWDESYGSPFSVTTQAYYGDDIPSLINSLEITSPPGEQWNYLSGNTQLLAAVLENATGRKVSDYASEKLWVPLGTASPALWSLDKANGTEKAYCCFNSNARDFARLGQLVLNGGRWNGRQLVPEQYLQQAFTPATSLVDEDGNPVDYYGYHWWIANYKGKQIPYARGILGQYIFIIPEKQAVVVRLGHQRDATYEQNHPKDIYLYLDAAYSMLP